MTQYATWPTVALGELLRVKHGFAFKGEHFEPSGEQLVLTPGNFLVGGGVQLRPEKERFYAADYPPEFRLHPGDLLIAMTDLTQSSPILGSPLFVPADRTYLHNQRLGKVFILDPERLDPQFAYFLFASDAVRSQLRGSATGSTVRHTAPGRIYAATIKLPPLSTQRKIAAILSAYDGLIEHNNRRIKLVEEMAQRIYREWFVEFRYPGHEDVPLVDSDLGPIPFGWKVVRFSDAIELVYGKALKADARRHGAVSVFGSGGVIGRHDEALSPGPGVIVGRKGNVGAVYWSDGAFFAIDTTYWIRSQLPLTYCYYALCDMDFLDSHAAVPGLSREQAYSLPLMVSAPDVSAVFDRIVSQVFAFRRRLEDSTTNLRAARDVLLPRLVSGEIDVMDLDIDVTDLAA